MKGFIPREIIKFVDKKKKTLITYILLVFKFHCRNYKLSMYFFTNLITSISYHDRRVQALYHRNQQTAGLFATLWEVVQNVAVHLRLTWYATAKKKKTVQCVVCTSAAEAKKWMFIDSNNFYGKPNKLFRLQSVKFYLMVMIVVHDWDLYSMSGLGLSYLFHIIL